MISASAQPRPRFLGVLRAHPWIAALVFLATLAGAVGYLVLRTPAYEASAEVLVTPLPSDQQSLVGLPLITETADSTRVAQTAAAILRSNSAADATVPQLPPGWDRDRVLRSITIEPRGESNLIAITGSADSAQLAARLANVYAQTALDQRKADLRRQISKRLADLDAELKAKPKPPPEVKADLLRRVAALQALEQPGDPTLVLSQRAQEPTGSTSPGTALVLMAAILAGLALALGATLLAYLIDGRIREEDELLRLSGWPVLARVPDSKRASALARSAEAHRTLLAQLEPTEGAPQTVMFTSPSSGDGKTTACVGLFRAAQEEGRSVLLLSFDVRKPTFATKRRARRATAELLDLPVDAEEIPRLSADGQIADVVVHPEGDSQSGYVFCDIPSGPSELSTLIRSMPRFVAEAREIADLVLVDTSPLGEVGDALRLLDHVDHVIVVARLGHTRRLALQEMAELLERSSDGSHSLLVIGSQAVASSPYYRGLAVGGP